MISDSFISKRVSILIDAALSKLPMLYHPFNVYIDSKRVIKHTRRSSFANITNARKCFNLFQFILIRSSIPLENFQKCYFIQ